MVERRDPTSNGDGMADVPIQQHFDRALREAFQRAEAAIGAVAERQDVALTHHRELHTVEHDLQERITAAQQQRNDEALAALQRFREDVDAALAAMVSQTEFRAHVGMYQERHTEVRDMGRGLADRVRIDLTRELVHETDQRQLEDVRIIEKMETNNKAISETVSTNVRSLAEKMETNNKAVLESVNTNARRIAEIRSGQKTWAAAGALGAAGLSIIIAAVGVWVSIVAGG